MTLIFIVGVCRSCFAHFYNVGHCYIDEICAKIKQGMVSNAKDLNDYTPAYSCTPFFKKQLNAIANKRGDFLNHDQIVALQIPNTVESLSCYAWMSLFFDLMGDVQPNKKEIHLEAISQKEIYDEVFILKPAIIPKSIII